MGPGFAPLFEADIARFLLGGLGLTLAAATATIVLSLAGGTVLALCRIAALRPLALAAGAYVEGVRSLPSFLVLVFVYFGVFRAGLDLGTLAAVVLGLTTYHSAKAAEIVRAGILSVDRGQTEAARSLGLSYLQTMASIVLPQGLRRMLPPLVSELVLCIKNTSIGSIVGLNELFRRGTIVYQQFFNPIETLLLLAVVYWAMCFGLSLVAQRLETGAAQRAERDAGGLRLSQEI
jgi:putative glutamine transport system permease protein